MLSFDKKPLFILWFYLNQSRRISFDKEPLLSRIKSKQDSRSETTTLPKYLPIFQLVHYTLIDFCSCFPNNYHDPGVEWSRWGMEMGNVWFGRKCWNISVGWIMIILRMYERYEQKYMFPCIQYETTYSYTPQENLSIYPHTIRKLKQKQEEKSIHYTLIYIYIYICIEFS